VQSRTELGPQRMNSGNDRGAAGRTAGQPHRRLWSDRFVGRERQLERIAIGLQSASDGRPNTLVLSCSAGTGATRLLAETRRRLGALAEPFAVVHGVALPATSGIPFAPVTAALERLLTPLDDDEIASLVGPTGDAVATLVPEIRDRLDELGLLPVRPRIAAPEWREARIFEAVLGLLERLGERRPVAVLLEDLHNADAATRGLVTFMARANRGQRLAMTVTYQPDRLLRSDPLRATLATLTSSEGIATADVPPLERAELGQLIEAIEGSRPSSSTLLLVSERSRGNPLIAEELLAARREQLGVSLSGSFERLVMARAALRSPECRRVLRLLSLAGMMVTPQTLMAIAAEFERRATTRPPRSAPALRRGEGLEGEVAAGVEEAIEHGFLVEIDRDASGAPARALAGAADEGSGNGLVREGDGLGGIRGRSRDLGRGMEDPDDDMVLPPAAARTGRGRPADEQPVRRGRPAPAAEPEPSRLIGFRHELIADAVAADLLPASRRRYHEALAAAMENGREPAMALGHFVAAHDLSAATGAALAAASAAEERDAGADALAHYELALGLYEIAPPDTAAPRLPDLYQKAAEAAFAAGDPSRAEAYAEAAAAALDAPGERPWLGLVMEALGRYRRAAGDHDGALAALRRAVELVPAEATTGRARVLAALAQFRMLEGVFSEARRCAADAVEVATAVGEEAREELLHARCTLAVADAWGEDPEPAVELLRQIRDEAADLGRLDDLFRVYANLTTVLDLLGRRDEAIAVAYEGIAEAEKAGQATVYGNFLRANAADSLFFLGRWQECRQLCLDALSWNPVGIWHLSPLLTLATLEVASNAGETAGRLLGQLLLAIETVQDPQYSVPAQQSAAAYALWQEDLPDAHRAAEKGWLRVSDTEDWLLMARMASTCLEVDAAIAADAHRRRDFATLAATRERSLPVLLRAEAVVRACGVSARAGSRRQADLALRTARAFRARIEGKDDPALWTALTTDWAELGDPYEAAKANWHQAEALLEGVHGRATRGVARDPITGAAEMAHRIGAWPLLRAVAELARRAMLPLPRPVEQAIEARREAVLALPSSAPSTASRQGARLPVAGRRGSPPVPASMTQRLSRGESRMVASFAAPESAPEPPDFGLSKRELEVLALIAEGLSNPEIGRRLYITRKTVAVHVSNILTKLGVSGRVEAAAAAIRLGLTEQD
jgi:DNA-binding CsgD family transcriptional regulator/predicted ATPase